MKKLVQAVLMSCLIAAPGCTPSPEKVCAKTLELVEKSDMGKEMKEKDKSKMKDDCVKEAAKQKDKEPDKYKAEAKCVMDAKEFEDAMKCVEKIKKKDGDD